MKTLGVVLLVIGVILTIFTTFKYFTKEKVVDLGKVEITKEQPHKIVWSPIAGIVIMGIGGIFLWQGSKHQ
jgi:H+/Cl- antiporter ClcA